MSGAGEPTSLIVEIEGRPWTLLFDVRGHDRERRARTLLEELRAFLPAGAVTKIGAFGPKDDPTRTYRAITDATPREAQDAFVAMDEAARKRTVLVHAQGAA